MFPQPVRYIAVDPHESTNGDQPSAQHDKNNSKCERDVSHATSLNDRPIVRLAWGDNAEELCVVDCTATRGKPTSNGQFVQSNSSDDGASSVPEPCAKSELPNLAAADTNLVFIKAQNLLSTDFSAGNMEPREILTINDAIDVNDFEKLPFLSESCLYGIQEAQGYNSVCLQSTPNEQVCTNHESFAVSCDEAVSLKMEVNKLNKFMEDKPFIASMAFSVGNGSVELLADTGEWRKQTWLLQSTKSEAYFGRLDQIVAGNQLGKTEFFTDDISSPELPLTCQSSTEDSTTNSNAMSATFVFTKSLAPGGSAATSSESSHLLCGMEESQVSLESLALTTNLAGVFGLDNCTQPSSAELTVSVQDADCPMSTLLVTNGAVAMEQPSYFYDTNPLFHIDAVATALEAELLDFVRNMKAYRALIHEQAQQPYLLSSQSCIVNVTACSEVLIAANKECLLPDEVLLRVFLYFTPFELSVGPAGVCRRWRRVASDASLWTKLEFRFNSPVAPHWLCYAASRAPRLHNLSLHGRTELLQDELAVIVHLCPDLRTLDLGFCNASRGTLCALADGTGCRHLESLNVEGSSAMNMDCIKALCRLPCLTELNLSHCQVITDVELIYLAVHMPSNLVKLNIDGISFITDQGIKELMCRHKDTLVSLDLDGAELTDRSLELVRECQRLVHLRVSFCDQLTDVSLVSIQNLVNLEWLAVRKGLQFTSSALTTALSSSDSVGRLRYLDLSECIGVNDSVVRSLCESCQLLIELHLCWCWEVTDAGLEVIALKCRNLTVLDLLGIDKITGRCLQEMPGCLPALQLLDLRQCNRILDDLMVDVLKRNPRIKAFNYYGESFSNI